MFDEKKKFKGNITLFITSLLIILSFGVLILNIEYVAVQASENKDIINMETNEENEYIKRLEEVKDTNSLIKFFEDIMVSKDKTFLENLLKEENIKYEDTSKIVKFDYKKWNVSIDYYKNYLQIQEK